MYDTICAIATSPNASSIAIIRVSGPESLSIVNKIFKGKDLKKVSSHTINYGYIVDNLGEIVDEALVSVMLSPKSYTTEDVVEINTHGGIICTNKVLELLLTNGCRLAEGGEFTKRAFLNGRIDLLEAEAVMDKINAQTEIQNKLANNQLSGKISNFINELKDETIQIISNINVNIDYPEYDDVDIITNEVLKPKLRNIEEKIRKLLKESKNGKLIKQGIKTAIIGAPNVGKSSLLNELIEEEKAIVTDIAGTTRDIVEGQINISGIPLNIIDTAGIRKTDDIVESIGVEKSLIIMEDADLILFVLNNNEPLNEEIKVLINNLADKNYLIIINKIDLPKKIEIEKINVDNSKILNMSIKEKKGLTELKNKIIELFNISQIELQDPTYLSSARSISILNKIILKIEEINDEIENNIPIDMIELDLRNIWEMLGTINGTHYEEELLDEMFSRFCLGK